MEGMENSLIHIHDFVSESWRDFRAHWNQSLSYTKWFVIGPAITFALVLATKSLPTLSSALATLGSFGSAILVIWAALRLSRATLARHEKIDLPKNEARSAWSLFLPFLWISILSGLAVLGGFFVFVLPGLWLMVTFKFGYYFLFLEDRRGTQALAASAALVKGRWWATFFRLLIIGLIYIILAVALVSIVTGLIGAVAGAAKLSLLVRVNFQEVDPLVGAARTLLTSLGELIFLPLFISGEVILFRSLRNSK
jgi:hypothetical protein